jgi:dienelactone hydrolase
LTLGCLPGLAAPMTYDPFARGPFPAGVRTHAASDAARDRFLAIEIWYPASEAHRGQDISEASRDHYELLPGFPPVTQDAVRGAAPRAGIYPLVLFSHGYAGHRRQSTFLCTHLASHGYVVAAVDHTGNTVADMMQMIMAIHGGAPMPDVGDALAQFITSRPADVDWTIDQLLAGAVPEVARLIDRDRIGMSGHSFGGWTTLMVAARNRRIRAALPLAPAGGWAPLPTNPLADALDFEWGRDVPTLYLVAARDSVLPLRGMRELFEKTRSPKRMAVLANADHMHFCDRIEEVHEMFRMMPPPGAFEEIAKRVLPIGELAPPEHGYRFVRGLGLAHMDATLKGDPGAAHLLTDIGAALAAQEVAVDVVE